MTVAASKGVTTPLQTAVTTGTGTAVSIPITAKNPRVHVRGSGTISGGTVVIEEANSPDYTGTWSTLQSITASTLTGGAEQVIHIMGTINAIRSRISSNILGGGDITVELVSD